MKTIITLILIVAISILGNAQMSPRAKELKTHVERFEKQADLNTFEFVKLSDSTVVLLYGFYFNRTQRIEFEDNINKLLKIIHLSKHLEDTQKKFVKKMDVYAHCSYFENSGKHKLEWYVQGNKIVFEMKRENMPYKTLQLTFPLEKVYNNLNQLSWEK